MLRWDSKIYHGIQHCIDDQGDTHIIIVNLRNPYIRVETVLSSRNGIECNSVNHNGEGKDPKHSNCGPPYPFEVVEDMLGRYVSRGGVAVINTDYFGFDGGHGAQGLAVKNGIRLDGPYHGAYNSLAYASPSLAFSPANEPMIGIPGSEAVIVDNLATTYYNAVGGWPIIVEQGEVIFDACCKKRLENYDASICYDSRAHSAAGVTLDGHLILIVAKNKTTVEIAEYLTKTFLVYTALNFDGGSSSSMAWLDTNGQIQAYHPYLDKQGQARPVAEGLLICSKKYSF